MEEHTRKALEVLTLEEWETVLDALSEYKGERAEEAPEIIKIILATLYPPLD